jgi:predicted RNase H-like nuclease
MRVAGADVWKGKWVVVVLDDGRFERAFVAAAIADAVAELADGSAIGVDMPIGLPPAGESRSADLEARAFVGPRRSAVFPTPSAALLERSSAAEANMLAKERGWPGISAQAFALKKQILAVQPLALADERIWEVHPEVSFAEASVALGGCQLAWSKNSWNGAALRSRIVASCGITVPADLGLAGAVDVPDVLDAAIAAWSADRIARGAGVSFPAGAERIGAIWR